MPRTTSAKKALRSSLAKRARNLAQNAQLDRLMRAFSRNAARSDADVRTIQQALDKAAKTGRLQPRRASRLKSRLMRPVATVATATAQRSPKKKPAAIKSRRTKTGTKSKH